MVTTKDIVKEGNIKANIITKDSELYWIDFVTKGGARPKNWDEYFNKKKVIEEEKELEEALNPEVKTDLTQEQKEGLQDMAVLMLAKGKQKRDLEKKLVKKYVDKNLEEPKKHPREILKEAKKEQEVADYKEGEINWVDGDFYDNYDKIKGHWHNVVKPNSKERFEMDETPQIEKWFFLAHYKDEIEGKPQLVHDTMQRIPLIRMTSKINKEGYGKDKDEWKTAKYTFFDERYDKRYDGAMIDSMFKDFWVSKVICKGKEHKVLSEEKLTDGKCRIKGMAINMADVSEMSNTLKVNSLAHVFMAKESESAIKTLSKENLVSFVKGKELNLLKILTHLSQHPSGSINNFPIEVEIMRGSVIFSGKVDGWPAHPLIMGPQGSRKTMGHGEILYNRFDETKMMASATNYRLKGLIPSFKKTPAEPGYILNCHRIAIIDESGKLVDSESNRHDREGYNIMGEFNDILEHKHRSGGSGNDFIDIDPTAKVWEITNPCSNKPTIYAHVGLIDPTKLSRNFPIWVQDEDEVEFVLGENGVIRNPPTPPQDPKEIPPYTMTSLFERYSDKNKKNKNIVLKKFRGDLLSKDDFLTIYDSCNAFVCEIDDKRVKTLVDMVTGLSKQPMTDVWRPRAYHHVKLLLDGLCKIRCLFDDYDPSFTFKEVDYKWAEIILARMVKGWDTDLSPKEEYR